MYSSKDILIVNTRKSHLVTECVQEATEEWIVQWSVHLSLDLRHDTIKMVKKVVEQDQHERCH